jgi:predicted N-acetyltransferase YhbS
MANHNGSIVLTRPRSDEISQIIEVLGQWQEDEEVVQLHPGDIGWFQRFGIQKVTGSLRTWSRNGKVFAIGLLDGPDLLRLAVSPQLKTSEDLAQQMAIDITKPERGILPNGAVTIEVKSFELLRTRLINDGWELDESWTSLALNLAEPIDNCGLRVEVTNSNTADVRSAVQRASFDNSSFTKENWESMASGSAYKNARCLVAYDKDENPVATSTAWSAGTGKPGLIEPLGVDVDHRGKGHGKAITLASAAALQEMGASSVMVCTITSNVGAIATYKATGFKVMGEVQDLTRS